MIGAARPPSTVAAMHPSTGKRPAEEVERALLALVSTGDRCAMDELYILYFARLANLFRNLTACADLAQELISDTMFEVWKAAASIGPNTSVSLAIMRWAYSRVRKRFAEWRVNQPNCHPAIQELDSRMHTAWDKHSRWQILLSKLPIEVVGHLVYASGYSRRDIADIMNISCTYVDVMLRDAWLRLRQ